MYQQINSKENYMEQYILDGRYVYLPLHKIVMCFNQIINNDELKRILNSEWSKKLKRYDNILLRKPDNNFSFETIHPYNMGILPTNECNLRCRYCYSETGEKPKQNLSKPQINHFINLMVKNAVLHSIIQNKRAESKLVISGGGEPTFKWEIFKYIVEYFTYMCNKHNVEKKIVLITNGIMSESKINYITKNIDQINLSADGYPCIQNTQRPTVNGKESFSCVDRFIKKCQSNGKELLVRVTVLNENFENLKDICNFFSRIIQILKQYILSHYFM